MGQIFTFDLGNNVTYQTPPVPNEREILYYDLPKKEQFWRTPSDKKRFLDIVPNIELRKWNEKDRVEYISNWRRIWADGLWIMNNGVPTYLNGLNIDHLVFNRFNGRFFNFLQSQKEDFYFREWIIGADKVDGGQYLKCRRLGMSAEEITENIRFLISDYHQNISLQSSTLDICKKTLMLPMIDTYLSRPSWMREEYYRSNGKRPRSALELVNVKSDDGEDSVSWLGGRANAYPTNAKALDGTENMKVTNDELSKIAEGSNPRDIVEVNRKTIRNAGRRGKHNLVSTSGDSDDVLTSFKEWQKLAAESVYDPVTGTSISGYVKRFSSAIHSQFLPSELLADKYGEINVDRNTEWVENTINKKQKGTKEYYYEKRKLPLTEDDALIAATDATFFRLMAIKSRKQYLGGLPDDKRGYVRGRLEERTDNGIVKVYFEVDWDNGKWMVCIHPYKDVNKNINCANRFTFSNRGVYFPPKNPEYLAAYDPIRYDKNVTTSGHLSRACIKVWKVWDYFNAPDTRDFVQDAPAALYIDRPDRAEDAHKEFIKAMKYWAAIGSVERQVESAAKEVEAERMTPFLTRDEKGIAGIWTTPRLIDNGISSLVSRFAPPQEEGQKDHIETCPFIDELIDLENFDRSNTTKFDIVMTDIFLEEGMKHIPYTNQKDKIPARMYEVLEALSPDRSGITHL